MKAIVHRRYGPPESLRLEELERPQVGDEDVLVRVRAVGLNPADWHVMRGTPRIARLMVGLRRPKQLVPGVDVAGIVEEVGASVTALRPGDEIFGARSGSLAELVVGGKNFLPKPSGLSFEQAGAVAVAGCTALQALRDKAHLQSGQRVLVNGAAGGVGTFAVQIAKSLGAHVTGVCSTRNVELVRSLGADQVVDYTVDDFTRAAKPYDVVLDLIGNHPPSKVRRILTPKGTAIFIGGEAGMRRLLAMLALNLFVGQHLLTFVAKINVDDLAALGELMESGKVQTVIDRTYPLAETPEAMQYLEAGHAQGKVVVIL
ncbi:MAG: NAD(P)-dependent alcohol dehydrogenase [Gaiellaceae bacterium]